MNRFIFTCGGTAGHINPALAVAEKLREILPYSEFLFIGAEGHMEMRLVPLEGFNIKGISITNISRSISLNGIRHNLKTINNVFTSTIEAKNIISDFKPDVVIGTGGYVCFPVLYAANKLDIPTVLLESNAYPGVTSKILSHFVNQILAGYRNTESFYKYPDRVKFTGTPVRGSFNDYSKAKARKELGIKDGDKVVVSILGSLGAEFMNGIIAEAIPAMIERNIVLIHSTGERYYDAFISRVNNLCNNYDSNKIIIRKYIDDMSRVMMAADLIICRAGASTISELQYIGKPAILVPSPNVTANHQEKNARVIENEGAAIVMTESIINQQVLMKNIFDLLDDDAKLEEMANNMKNMSTNNAVDEISNIIINYLN